MYKFLLKTCLKASYISERLNLGQKNISFMGLSIWKKLSYDLEILNVATLFSHNCKNLVLKKAWMSKTTSIITFIAIIITKTFIVVIIASIILITFWTIIIFIIVVIVIIIVIISTVIVIIINIVAYLFFSR